MNPNSSDESGHSSEHTRLQDQITALRRTNVDLEMLLKEKTARLEKVQIELGERMAERIKLTNSSQRSEDRYRTLISNIPGVVYRCANDAYYTVEFISDQIYELSGYPASDFVQNKKRSFTSIIHNEDVIDVVNSVNRALESKEPYIIEYRIRHIDGSERWVWEKGQGVFEGEEMLWLDGIIFDRTDRRTTDRTK